MAKKSATATAEKKVDFMSAVASVATLAQPASKKNVKPVVVLPEALHANLAAVAQAKADLARAEANLAANAEPIINHVRGIQDTDGCAGNFSGSYELEAKDTRALFVSTDKWSAVKDEAIVAELKALGAEAAVRETYEIKVKDEVLEDAKLQQELMAAVGPVFAKFFTATKKIVAVKGLSEKIYTLAGNDKARVAKIRELVKQYSPYIK